LMGGGGMMEEWKDGGWMNGWRRGGGMEGWILECVLWQQVGPLIATIGHVTYWSCHPLVLSPVLELH